MIDFKKIQNVLGWHTNKKIVVFESDDWGSDRFTPDSRKYYLDRNIDISKNWMSRFDVFENDDDLMCLSETLKSIPTRSSMPKFTILFNPANPDFYRIKRSNYSNYFYETFKTRTLKSDLNLLKIYKKMIADEEIEMAFHGREHLYVDRWMRDLRSNNKIAIEGFNQNVWGFSPAYLSEFKNYRASYDLDQKEDLIFQKKSIVDGIKIMKDEFEVPIRYFLPPDGNFSLSMCGELIENGVKYIGLSKKFKDSESQKNHFFWLNKTLKKNLRIISRNCSFEPASPAKSDWVDACLFDIKNAFEWRKPAVISTHRVNYVGGMEVENRNQSSLKLKKLLNTILKKWPDVYFLTTSQLGDLMSLENYFKLKEHK